MRKYIACGELLFTHLHCTLYVEGGGVILFSGKRGGRLFVP